MAVIAKGRVPVWSLLPLQHPFFLAWHGHCTDISWISLENWSVWKEGGWSGWINCTAMQRDLSAHGRGTPQRWTKRWCCCFLAGPCCLTPAVLGHGSTMLTKGTQFTVKQGGRSRSHSLHILAPTAFWCPPLFLLDSFVMARRGGQGVGSWLLPRQPAVLLTWLHRNPPTLGTKAGVWKHLFGQCTPRGAHLIPCHVVS